MSTNFEQYENLPGVKVSYEDGNLFSGNENASAATQSVLIVGTALDGPIGEPVSVNAIGGPKAAEKMYGGILQRQEIEEDGVTKTIKVPHKGNLIRAMWEAIRSGCEDVRLMRVTGTHAKTEISAKDPNSDVNQPLADALNNNLALGNTAFHKLLGLTGSLRLVKIEKVEEFAGTDTTVAPIKTFNDADGYNNVDTTVGYETVFFAENKFRPGNTVRVTYKAKDRNYTEVTRNDDGVANPASTKGVLSQDIAMTNYFQSEVANWSDDPMHTVNVYVVDAAGNVNAIPSVNGSGEFLYRPGKEDATVTNELTDFITANEFQQGGVRFTSAYQAEVGAGTYPTLDATVKVYADYFYYHDLEVSKEVEEIVPGAEKNTSLNFIPTTGTLEVYYEVGTTKTLMTDGTDYTITYPSDSAQKPTVHIKAGAAPLGSRLFATYKTGEKSIQNAKLVVEAANAGDLYGGIKDKKDYESLYGVKFSVEYPLKEDGSADMENRLIRFTKPVDKRNSSIDTELTFNTQTLTGIRTLREFANYVNSLAGNNIIKLDVPLHAGEVSIKGLSVTDYEYDPTANSYKYRLINLGEKYNEDSNIYELYVDESKPEVDESRFPWLGSNGFFNVNSLESTHKLYEALGGKYELVPGTYGEYNLVEQGVYSKLENYTSDIIWLAEVHANTAVGAIDEEGNLIVAQDRNFATQLAQHCAMVTAKTWETIGVIGMAPSPANTLAEVQRYVDIATGNIYITEDLYNDFLARGINAKYINNHYMYNAATHEQIFNDEGEPIDIGRYVSVVFGPEIGLAHEKIGNYVVNGAGIYASLVSTLQPEISTTNRQITALGLRYTLSESQHNQLAGGHYVSFESKIQGNGTRKIVVKDGTTAATSNSDYQRLSTVRIAHATVQLIRAKADKFIGLPNGIAQRNALSTEIQAGLDRLKELGVLQDFKFSIYSSARDRVLGNAFITLELVPAYEIRKIYTSVSLRASL